MRGISSKKFPENSRQKVQDVSGTFLDLVRRLKMWEELTILRLDSFSMGPPATQPTRLQSFMDSRSLLGPEAKSVLGSSLLSRQESTLPSDQSFSPSQRPPTHDTPPTTNFPFPTPRLPCTSCVVVSPLPPPVSHFQFPTLFSIGPLLFHLPCTSTIIVSRMPPPTPHFPLPTRTPNSPQHRPPPSAPPSSSPSASQSRHPLY